MPNSFTVFPNVLPGNVTIGGNLTVNGDQLRIGAAAPFVRVGKDSLPLGMLSYNVDFTGVGRDNNSLAAFRWMLSSLDNAIFSQRTNSAGTVRGEANQTAIFTDYTAHAHTGTVTEDTIYTKLIPANTLGANGGLRIVFAFTASAQGAGNTTVRIKFAGATAFTNLIAAVTTLREVDVIVVDSNSLVTQFARSLIFDFQANTFSGGTISGVANFGNDVVFSVTVQNANLTDTQTFQYMEVQQLNSFGPV